MSLKIVPRRNWTDVGPKYVKPRIQFPATKVFYMKTFTNACYTGLECAKILQHTQNHHMISRNLPDIRYNFMIGDDGVVYEGRGWYHLPDLPVKYASYNPASVLIAFIGKYYENNLTTVLTRAASDLIDYAVQYNFIAKDYKRKKILKYALKEKYMPTTDDEEEIL